MRRLESAFPLFLRRDLPFRGFDFPRWQSVLTVTLIGVVIGLDPSLWSASGMPDVPPWLYSVWVGGNALSGAIPTASLGYSIGGIIIGLIPAMPAAMVVFACLRNRGSQGGPK